MLVDATLGFVNHLLAGEDWARQRLQPFAGQTARCELGVLSQTLEITAAGLFSASDTKAPPNVSNRLPADAPLRALTDRPSLLAAAHVSGAAELAETLGFIVRNLRWDVESDLSSLVGDIAARRLFNAGKHVLKWQQAQARNLALNLTEYFSEEQPTIVARHDLMAFRAAVAEAQDELARLEKRVAFLEG